MHLYNSWLPPPVAAETEKEKETFARVVKSVRELYSPSDPDSVYSTLKWISVLDLFIKAKSDVCLSDVSAVIELGLEIFSASRHKLYAQVRWGNLLVKIINKYRKKVSFTVHWKPLYETLVRTHFTRGTGPEGWRIKQRHFETVTSLVRSCRRFFPSGSATEIWLEFSSLLDNPWHNSSFEGSGFLRLFLPTNTDNQDFFSKAWIEQCIEIWDSIPNCPFWNGQWTAVLARVIKNYNTICWEPFLPSLFMKFLNMFEVPVANGVSSYPFSTDVPRNTRFLFSNKTYTPSKSIAKSIVYLLRPGSRAQDHFEKLVNLLEQYYHPSNGGRWTNSLERFLLSLVVIFQQRLQNEQQNIDNKQVELFLERSERRAFVSVVLKLIERGQYSKNEHLSETVATATSILSYVEPSLVLPFVASRFHMALETMTATHQLKTAVTSVAYSGRSLFFASRETSAGKSDVVSDADSFVDILMISLSNSLLGMDANDPPKTLATMQLIGAIFSNMASLEDNMDELSPFSTIHFSEWLDEFLCRLFTLLLHLEPSSVVNEELHTAAASGTFLVEEGPYYFCMLEILLGRLSPSLYTQALNKISKFVQTNILPGAIAEVGLLCCACVYSNPEEATVHLVEPMLSALISSLRGAPNRGFGGTGTFDPSSVNKAKTAISPAMENAIDYQLKVLSVAISYVGPSLLRCQDQLKEVLSFAFESSSWKVNGGGDHLLRSLLGSLILYYPLEQYRCISHHPDTPLLERWVSTKDHTADKPLMGPKWHVPCEAEVAFANELLSLHLLSALDELMKICKYKFHTDAGIEKDHLKVTLLRIDSSLQGVSSCLPDLVPSFSNGGVEDHGSGFFLVAGATGSKVGSTDLRERAADVIHAACKYLLEEKSDDSILLLLVIRIMDALVNYGSSEYEEWASHKQAWKLDSAAIIEPSVNFITASHAKGKKRPYWAVVDKAYMHNTWRASQSSFHLYRTSGNISPSNHAICLMDDLLSLALHRYETVRIHAGRSLLKLIKRWPTISSRCLATLTENLANASTPEHAVLGSCTILSTQTVLKQLTRDTTAFTSFITGILKSSHHESLKAQKAITELFVKFNILFAGVSKSIFKSSNSEGQSFADFISQITSLSFDTNGLHWRYNLMANRVLLLLVMASRSDPNSSSNILSETAGHFLKNLKSQLPQTRILAISALNTLLKESPHKMSYPTLAAASGDVTGQTKSSLEEALVEIFQEDGFFDETFSSLSHVHIISDAESSTSRGNHRNSSIQSVADKSITLFYFDFSASWPRTPSWMTLFGGNDTFYPNFARIFKRLSQECGVSLLVAFKSALEEFSSAKERSKQCVAAEAFAGALHSDVNGLSEAWEIWMKSHLQSIILASSVESIPEWACCIRYAVTGKGKQGKRVPLLRSRIIDCLLTPLPQTVATSIVAKRYAFLALAFAEVCPTDMREPELLFHQRLLKELLLNLSHSSSQVREAVGVTLGVVVSNIQLYTSAQSCLNGVGNNDFRHDPEIKGWSIFLSEQAANRAIKIQTAFHCNDTVVQGDVGDKDESKADDQEDVKWMETVFHFVIASLKSGRASYLVGPLADMLYPVISLQETSHKDLSTLAKVAFELLKWKIFTEPHLQKVVGVVLSAVNDSNWRTRSAALTYLRTFMYRHTFILSSEEKEKIWKNVESLLIDNQIEVREHAAAVLAGLMKGGDENLAKEFRDRAFVEASAIWTRRTRRSSKAGRSVAYVHGAVLALVACVLSVPYDMPSWLPEHVTLLARFVSEPSPVRSTVTKAIAEFRRTHADMWNFQKVEFTEEQLEILADTSSSSSYFA